MIRIYGLKYNGQVCFQAQKTIPEGQKIRKSL